MKRSQETDARLHGASGRQPAAGGRHERDRGAPSGAVGHVLSWWWATLLAIAIGVVSGWLSVQLAFFLLTLRLHV